MSTDVGSATSTETPKLSAIDMALEVLTVPVSDVDGLRFERGRQALLRSQIAALGLTWSRAPVSLSSPVSETT